MAPIPQELHFDAQHLPTYIHKGSGIAKPTAMVPTHRIVHPVDTSCTTNSNKIITCTPAVSSFKCRTVLLVATDAASHAASIRQKVAALYPVDMLRNKSADCPPSRESRPETT
eukprot:4589205-Amphidinium_carterae.3